jgi:hypothetical protein
MDLGMPKFHISFKKKGVPELSIYYESANLKVGGN